VGTKRVAVEHHLARWGGVREGKDTFLPLPVDRTIELRFELDEDWDGAIDLDPEALAGARVKPIVFVAGAVVDRFDRDDLRLRIIHAGAIYCRAPLVHVVRTVVRRDERHAVEVPLEESLRMFAEETSPAGADRKVAFAAGLARAADGGERE
jgi:hypothetical protein